MKKKCHQQMDETDMFFLRMAKMTKTLPPLEQAKIKLQLSNSVPVSYTHLDVYKRQPPKLINIRRLFSSVTMVCDSTALVI